MDLRNLIKSKKQQLSRGNRERAVKPPSGESRWRILPSWRDKEHPEYAQFWRDFGQHFIKGNDGKLQSVYVCVDKTFDKECPLCLELYNYMSMAQTDAQKEKIREAYANTDILVNAIDRSKKTDSTEVVLLALRPTAFKAVLNEYEAALRDLEDGGVEFSDDFNPITDLAKGMDIRITRTGQGMSTEYNVSRCNVSKPVPESAMANAKNLDDYVEQESNSALLKAQNSLKSYSISSAPRLTKQSSTMIADDNFDPDADVGIFEGELVEEVEPTPAPKAQSKLMGTTYAKEEVVMAEDEDLDGLLNAL